MSATMEKHVRIRIFFENTDKAPTWLLVNNESMYTIQDLENEIRQRYFGNTVHVPLVMSLDGCVLPKSERTVILRDNDRVVVSESSHTESSSALSLTSEKEKTQSADLDYSEKTKYSPNNQNKTKSKKENLQGTSRKEKKRAVSADLSSSDEMTESELATTTQDKKKNAKKKRKFDKCEKINKLNKTPRKQKKKNTQIEETHESQLSVNTSVLKKKKKFPKNKNKKRKTESPVWDFNKKSNKESLAQSQKDKLSRESISTAMTNIVPLNNSVETEVSVTKSEPFVNKNKPESLGKGMGKDEVQKDETEQEGGEEEKGVKKRRRRRRRQQKINMEAEASEPNNKKKKYSDNKMLKPFHAKPFQKSIDIYSRKNKHKVFDDSEPEDDTLSAQKSWTVMEGTKTDQEEQMKSLQEAKQRLLEKVDQEYKSVTDHSDIINGHLPSTQPINETVQELTTNKPPYKTVQEPSTYKPPHRIVQLQQPVIGIEQEDTSMSSVQLKLSALANGVPVYTRQRQKRYFNASQGKELSKEAQLNTNLTNMSIIITNNQPTAEQKPSQESVCQEKPRPADTKPVIPAPVQDYTKFPPLQGTPRQGDKIAYKILELSDSYTPEVSNYKEGVVLNFDHDAQLVEIDTKPGGSDSRPQGKFYLDYDYGDNHHKEPKQSLPWESLLETRLLDIV